MDRARLGGHTKRRSLGEHVLCVNSLDEVRYFALKGLNVVHRRLAKVW